MFERCIFPSRNTYISQPSSESYCNAWTMYYCLQIRVARCRRRFHLKLLLAHGFLQTFPSFIQCVNAIGSYYVKICLICSEIHIWLANTVIFYQAFDDKYKQPRQIIWYRDHWTSNEVDKQSMKCLSRVLKCTAIFFSLEKDPFSVNFNLGHCRLCRWQYLPIRIELFTGDVGYLHIMTFFLSK